MHTYTHARTSNANINTTNIFPAKLYTHKPPEYLTAAVKVILHKTKKKKTQKLFYKNV